MKVKEEQAKEGSLLFRQKVSKSLSALERKLKFDSPPQLHKPSA